MSLYFFSLPTRYVSVSFSKYKPLTLFLFKVFEYLLDISQHMRLGQNKLSQVDSMSDYLVVLCSHYPTENQIKPLRENWDEKKRFREQLAWLVRPFPQNES